jgi:hypothetical protein
MITRTVQTIKITLSALLSASILAAPALAADARVATDAITNAQAAMPSGEQRSQPASTPPMPKHNEGGKGLKTFEKVMGLVIALVAIVMGIGVAFFGIWYDYKKRHDIVTACHRERMAALEKGLELPPYPPDWLAGHPNEVPTPRSPIQGLKAGLMWLAIGLASTLYLYFQERAGIHPTIGAVPFGIGIVYLVCFAIERRKTQAQTR